MYVRAMINKSTLPFIRKNKQISFEYVERIIKYNKQRILQWEDLSNDDFPTLKQAKAIAACFRVLLSADY